VRLGEEPDQICVNHMAKEKVQCHSQNPAKYNLVVSVYSMVDAACSDQEYGKEGECKGNVALLFVSLKPTAD